VYFAAQLIGQIPATTWVLFTEHRFNWNGIQIGLSLAMLGLMHALFQATLTGRITQHWGEKNTILIGFIADATAFFCLAFILQAWLIYPIIILLAGGGIALPALQSWISQSVNQHNQGKLQGILVSIANASGIIGPPTFAWIYGKTQNMWDGSIWILGVLLYALIIIFLIKCQKSTASSS
jgi:DHA1 family tetracycline resistance protein-like MFS transporter